MPIVAFVISLILINSGEYSVILTLINPVLLILSYFIDDITTDLYKIYHEYLSIIAVISTSAVYILVGLLIDYKKSKSNNK